MRSSKHFSKGIHVYMSVCVNAKMKNLVTVTFEQLVGFFILFLPFVHLVRKISRILKSFLVRYLFLDYFKRNLLDKGS